IREDLKKEVQKAVIDIDITKTWLYQQGMQEGIQKGRKEGVQKGRKEGIREGIKKGIMEGIRKGLKEALLSDVKFKFGRVSKLIKKEIMQIDDINKLRFLKKEVLKSRTLKEFEKKLKSADRGR
ncbi:MAG: hypothetical protein N2254_09630, partial [bacterium]|nr:hypothetical protein [bacterium]